MMLWSLLPACQEEPVYFPPAVELEVHAIESMNGVVQALGPVETEEGDFYSLDAGFNGFRFDVCARTTDGGWTGFRVYQDPVDPHADSPLESASGYETDKFGSSHIVTEVSDEYVEEYVDDCYLAEYPVYGADARDLSLYLFLEGVTWDSGGAEHVSDPVTVYVQNGL